MPPFNVVAGADGVSLIEWSPEPLPLRDDHRSLRRCQSPPNAARTAIDRATLANGTFGGWTLPSHELVARPKPPASASDVSTAPSARLGVSRHE